MDLVWSGMPRLAQFGESVSCREYAYVPGGKGANQAVAAAAAGAETYMAGCLGDDANGNLIYERLAEKNISMEYSVKSPDMQTGLALMLIEEKSGKYVSYHVMGGNAEISASQVEKALDGVKPDMVLLNFELPLETMYRTCEMARARDIRVFLDAGPAMSISLDRVQGVFIISPNEPETKALTGIDPDTEEHMKEAAVKLYENAKPEYVLLKLGEKGAYLYDGKDGRKIPAFKVKAIDSTAAGDTFGGTFGAYLCRGNTIEDAICYAQAAAGICVSRMGGQPSIPSWEETEAFLAEHKCQARS